MADNVIFIIGISPRCGSNFMKDILCLHPQIEFGSYTGEDHVLRHIHHVHDFLEGVKGAWKETWGNSITGLRSEISEGILKTISSTTSTTSKYAVCKTPLPDNIHLFHTFFHKAKLIILIRDGRDIVDSDVNTFQSSFLIAIKKWARGAKILKTYLTQNHNQNSFHLVRYEDLVSNPEITVTGIIKYLELDSFPFEKMQNLPVRGSSQIRDLEGKVNWAPSDYTNSDPGLSFVGRHIQWSFWKRIVFQKFGARLNADLGYDK